MCTMCNRHLSASALLICEQRGDGLGQPLLVEVAAGEDEEGVDDVDEDVLTHSRISVLEVGEEDKAEKTVYLSSNNVFRAK